MTVVFVARRVPLRNRSFLGKTGVRKGVPRGRRFDDGGRLQEIVTVNILTGLSSCKKVNMILQTWVHQTPASRVTFRMVETNSRVRFGMREGVSPGHWNSSDTVKRRGVKRIDIFHSLQLSVECPDLHPFLSSCSGVSVSHPSPPRCVLLTV